MGATLQGKRSLKQTLEDYKDGAADAVAGATESVARDVQGDARRYAPVDTGNLKASITVERVGPFRWEVYTNKEYAMVQEFGITDVVQISSHTRVMTEGFGDSGGYPQAVQVDAHDRRMDIEGKFYMTIAASQNRRSLPKRISRALRALS
jgi:hypothetical protein